MEENSFENQGGQSFNQKIILANTYIKQIHTIGAPANHRQLISNFKILLKEIEEKDKALGEEINTEFKKTIKARLEEILKKIPTIKNKDSKGEISDLFLGLMFELPTEDQDTYQKIWEDQERKSNY